MIKFIDISKSFGAQLLLDRVSFTINRQERIGLVGRNGHGKTTLFRILLRREEHDHGQLIIPKNYQLGYLEQHIAFTQPTVLGEACQALTGYERYDSWQAEKILTGLGFTTRTFDEHPQNLSGGFQVRLNLAKVLIQNPDCLLLDEPTNYLDIVSIRWLADFLKKWPNELMLVTHDRSFMDQVTTHIVGIHRQKLRKLSGSTQKYFNQLLKDEEIIENTRINEEKKRQDTEQFIARFRAKARLAGLVQSRIKSLEKSQKLERLQKIEELDFRFPSQPFPGKIMMDVQQVSFGYDSTYPDLISQFDLTIGKKDRIAIIGKNGKGKSTLLKLLHEDLLPNAGQIKKHPSLTTGYFGQTNIARLNPTLTIEQELAAAVPDGSLQPARNIAGVMMFSGDQLLKRIQVLSGGERSRVLLGKLLLTSNHLLLLDEPTNHLDLESCQALLSALQHFDGSVVMVTHDELFLEQLATKLIVFNQDRLMVFNGSYQQFLTKVGWDEEAAPSPNTVSSAPFVSEPSNKKALRQAKAKMIQDKSRKLNPLNQVIAQLEEEIEKNEAVLARTNQALIDAASNGEITLIASLPNELKRIQSRLNDQYDQLTARAQEVEELTARFDKQLQELSSD